MLHNPFTPTEIASDPDDFYGRAPELQLLARSLAKGSVIIAGPMGIGKSSLLAYARLHMEGFGSEHNCRSVVLVGNKGITSLDDAARWLVQQFIQIDQKTSKIKFMLPKLFEFESSEVVQNYKDKHHLQVAMRTIEQEYSQRQDKEDSMLLIAIDEADKCPEPIAQLVRALTTHAQQLGIKRLRFLVAGVSPFYEKMLAEDAGVARFFYKVIQLQPLDQSEARDLMESKLKVVLSAAREQGFPLELDPAVIGRLVTLSGGHPHLLQLLGSHIVEHENENPDGHLDSRDLHDSLVRICYEDRAAVYSSLLHELELYNHFDSLLTLLGLSSISPSNIVNKGFPTTIDRQVAQTVVEGDELKWLVSHNIIRSTSANTYGLVDEFLRVRLILDLEESEIDRKNREQKLINARIRLEY
jgi:hypothetical protein